MVLPVEKAAIWSLLAGYLLLPSSTFFKVELLPPIDKFTVPAATTFLLCWLKGTDSPAPRRSLLVYLLAFLFIVSPIATSFYNSYELPIGPRSIPGFYPVDAVKLAAQNALTLAPFFIGLRFISSDESRALLLRCLAVAGLLYSLPMLFEVRMSPQLHTWVYGFFPHSFVQQIRGASFRPVVFLSHGLEVALFTSLAVISAVAAARARWRLLRMPAGAAATYLCGVLLLCRSMASIMYTAVAAPLILFTSPRTWVRIACAMLLLVASYPMLRTAGVIPVEQIVGVSKKISIERSASLETRLTNEDKLLAKANQKPLAGWGTWGRNRIYDEASGENLSITDGEWIIRFGMFGWLGYISLFGLFAVAGLRASKVVKGPVTEAKVVLASLALVLAVNVFDLIPNADLIPLTYLIAGSVAGCVRVRSLSRRPALAHTGREMAALAG